MPLPPPTAKADNLTPLGEALITLVFLAAGGAIEAVAFGLVHVAPSPQAAPPWVIALAGLVFLSGSFLPQAARRGPDSAVTRLIGAVMVCALGAIMNWIAFGPGPRSFSGGISLPGLSASAADSERTGRVFFGCFAVLLDAVVLASIIDALRGRRGAPPAGAVPSPTARAPRGLASPGGYDNPRG